MLKVEFHCHTDASGDCQVRVEDLLDTCREKGIDRVVITDHNTIAGAVAAQKLDPERVIVGEEVLTTKGELLCAFVKEEVPAWLEPSEAIRRLRSQGAVISVSHPFDSLRSGHWKLEDLMDIAPLVDAIETFNARCLRTAFNKQAQEFATQHGLLGTTGSDAHTLFELGRAHMRVAEFKDADGLRAALKNAEHVQRGSSVLVRLASRYAALRKRF